MSSFIELYVDQGATFNHIINLTDDVNNDFMNIEGFIVESQMRRSYYSKNASANIVCTVTNPTTGEITLSLDAHTTQGLKPGKYLFDVKTTDTANTTSRILEGIITVTPCVTR